jgi:hypothetical protein
MKVVDFITVNNDIITGHHSGDINVDFSNTIFHNHKRIEVPVNSSIESNENINWYDKNWKRIPDVTLIK